MNLENVSAASDQPINQQDGLKVHSLVCVCVAEGEAPVCDLGCWWGGDSGLL